MPEPGELVFLASKVLEDHYLIVFLALLALAMVVLKRNKRALLAAMLLVAIVVPVLKLVYAQARPCAPGGIEALVACSEGYGLPSMHAAAAVLFAMASLGSAWFFFFAPLAAFVAYSRIYLGVHSVEQVAAGAAAGIALYSLALYAASKAIEGRKREGQELR